MVLLSLGQGLVRLGRLLAEHGHFARRVASVLGRLGKISQLMAQGLQVPRLSANLLGQVANSLGAWLRVASPLAAAVGRRGGGMEVIVGVVVVKVVGDLGMELLLGEGFLIKREIFSLVFHIGRGGPI